MFATVVLPYASRNSWRNFPTPVGTLQGFQISNRPFVAEPSRDLLFIKLWAATLRNRKSMSKTSKWPSLKPLALKNEIL